MTLQSLLPSCLHASSLYHHSPVQHSLVPTDSFSIFSTLAMFLLTPVSKIPLQLPDLLFEMLLHLNNVFVFAAPKTSRFGADQGQLPLLLAEVLPVLHFLPLCCWYIRTGLKAEIKYLSRQVWVRDSTRTLELVSKCEFLQRQAVNCTVTEQILLFWINQICQYASEITTAQHLNPDKINASLAHMIHQQACSFVAQDWKLFEDYEPWWESYQSMDLSSS